MTGQRDAVLAPRFLDDLDHWIRPHPRTATRLIELIRAILRDPFAGLGKPEPLKQMGANFWSRRLTDADRVVYVVYDDRVEFLQARYHYR